MQSTAETAKKKPELIQPAPKTVEPAPNPFLPKPAELPANPYETAERSQKLQKVPKIELPKPKPAEKQRGEPLTVAKLETEAGEAKITPAQRLHEKFSEMRKRIAEGEPPPVYNRGKPENRPRGPAPGEEGEGGPKQRLDRMSRLGSVAGRRPYLEQEKQDQEQQKKKEKPKEGGEETNL